MHVRQLLQMQNLSPLLLAMDSRKNGLTWKLRWRVRRRKRRTSFSNALRGVPEKKHYTPFRSFWGTKIDAAGLRIIVYIFEYHWFQCMQELSKWVIGFDEQSRSRVHHRICRRITVATGVIALVKDGYTQRRLCTGCWLLWVTTHFPIRHIRNIVNLRGAISFYYYSNII